MPEIKCIFNEHTSESDFFITKQKCVCFLFLLFNGIRSHIERKPTQFFISARRQRRGSLECGDSV